MPDRMTATVRVGIVGYGNLGRGAKLAVARNVDLSLVGIFSRRPPAALKPAIADTSVFHVDALEEMTDKLDVLLLCGGSQTDLPEQSPRLARQFCIVDSFDTHARIPEHFAAVDEAARAGGTTALISAGWDPGLFSIQRLMGEALLPTGQTHTFWGRGLSQGHSDALRRVAGVADAVQYTLPDEALIERIRAGEPVDPTASRHQRQCFVVLKEGADAAAVRQAIVTMPHYFAGQDTRVDFISAEELARDHTAMPHGGFVLRHGHSSAEAAQLMEYRLALESNPEFTASVLVACARAVYRLHRQGVVGALSMLDVAPALFSPRSPEELRSELL